MPARPQTHYARGQARKERLLEAAAEEIAERGLEGITHRSVAARAGVPASTTSYFFTSIDELIAATVTQIARQVVDTFEPLVTEAASGGVDPAAFADRLIDLLTQARPHQVVVQFEAYLATSRRPELREAVQRIMTSFEEATATALTAVGVEDADAVARQFVAVIDGFALHRIAWSRGRDDHAALQAVLRRLLDSYLPVGG